MGTDEKLYQILSNEDKEYNNNPELIKLLLDYRGKEGHQKIQKELFKKLISKYVNLNLELKEKIAEVTRLSETDELTKIYNRVKFKDELKTEISRVNRYQTDLAIIMFDIDHFKQVNDNYGHDVGDEVLVKVTDIVSKEIRPTDIFARWGGEEFMILVPSTRLSSSFQLAERLRKVIADYNFAKVGQVTCSFGVTEFRDEEETKTFIKRVDNALYTAKEEGRNRVVKQ